MDQTPEVPYRPDKSPLIKSGLDIDTLKREFARGELILGGQIISPTAVNMDERNLDGSLDFRPARERGLLSAIVSAASETSTRSEDGGSRSITDEERVRNIQEIVAAGLALDLDYTKILDTLKVAGVSYDTIVTTRLDQDGLEGKTDSSITRQINILRVSDRGNSAEAPPGFSL